MKTNSTDHLSALPLIAHVVYRFDYGGLENGIVNLINATQGKSIRHCVIALTEATDAFRSRLRVPGVELYELGKRPGKDFAAYFRFFRLIRRLRPAILHTRNIGTLDCAVLGRLAGVSICIHGEHGWHADDPFGRSVKYRFLRRAFDVAVNEYVAVSRDIETWLRDSIGIRADRIVQIYNGVDVDKFNPKGSTVTLPFDNVGNSLLVIGTVGRLDRIKNFDMLIKAVAQLVDHNPDLRERLRSVIVGDGPQLTELRNLVNKLGLQEIVFLPGKRQDIDELLRSMNIFVLPSLNEGISNTILESMVTGLPIIATEVGGNPELIADGETGSLVPANNTDAIVEAIKRYVYDPRLTESHGRAARDRAVRLFSLRAMIESYGQLYDRLLSNSSRAPIS
jgi:sugar transferase (PEP-CTERM/EpsH1 system associated)